MLRKVLIVLALLAMPSLAQAQAPTSYTLKVFNQGATTPVTTTVLPASAFPCGQQKAVVLATTHNATKVSFNDPADVTLDCRYTDPGTGPLLALPFGTNVYVVTLNMTNSIGLTSPDSGSSNPFDHAGTAPLAPANVRVH
jgi:hypothetical protein